MKLKAVTIFLCMAVILSMTARCGKTAGSSIPQPTAAELSDSGASVYTPKSEAPPAETTEYIITLDGVSDSSDLPDWPGKQLKLNYWAGHGTGGSRAVPHPNNDVVVPEITRVTGVTIDEDSSFDNGGSDYFQRLALIVACDEWPGLIWDSENIRELIDCDLVYDLTDYFPKYAPDLMKKIPIENKVDFPKIYEAVHTKTDDGLWSIPFGLQQRFQRLIYPELDTQFDRQYFGDAELLRFPFYVREDILQMVYPDAMPLRDIKDIYAAKGEFTMDQIYDVPIKTIYEFYDFFYKIRDLKLTNEDNQPVYASYARSGQDPWALFAYGSLAAMYGADQYLSYFTY